VSVQALLSIHDVMPETLAPVRALRDELLRLELPPPALLVVPGRQWRQPELQTLRAWAAEGSELVAHGWLHRTTPQRLRHRLHAWLISRDVAEHLALKPDAVCALMRRSAGWFADHDLPTPITYIPPAWALGMHAGRLADLPYRFVETLAGVHRIGPEGQDFVRLPLLGFEADTTVRALSLGFWNRLQLALAGGRPVRIGLHPRDASLRLSQQLRQHLSRSWHCLDYADLGTPGDRPVK
jgi:predicted deacetylase